MVGVSLLAQEHGFERAVDTQSMYMVSLRACRHRFRLRSTPSASTPM